MYLGCQKKKKKTVTRSLIIDDKFEHLVSLLFRKIFKGVKIIIKVEIKIESNKNQHNATKYTNRANKQYRQVAERIPKPI